jgi:hypothetical protein
MLVVRDSQPQARARQVFLQLLEALGQRAILPAATSCWKNQCWLVLDRVNVVSVFQQEAMGSLIRARMLLKRTALGFA